MDNNEKAGSEFYDEKYYDGAEKRNIPPETRKLVVEKMKRLAAYLFPRLRPRRVLDLGCGRGEMAGVLSELGVSDVFGVDISEYAISEAAGTNAGKVAICDISALGIPFVSNYFDLVLALDVLEHVRDPENVLREINRVLAPGGRLFVTVPGPLSPNAAVDPSHINIWPYRKWRRAIEMSGFRCTLLFYYYFFFPSEVPEGFMPRIVYRIKKIRFHMVNKMKTVKKWRFDDYMILAGKRA